MQATKVRPDSLSEAEHPTYLKFQRSFLAMCLVLGPLLMIVSVFLNPDRTGNSNSGSVVIAAWMAAGSGISPLSFLITVAELFLLPFGALGMTMLAIRHSPWLASLGGFLYLTGLMAFGVFVGQGVQTRLMAEMGGGPQLVTLWEHFNTDPVITAYLYIVVIGLFIFGPLLLGIALGRAHLIPVWAMWALILRAPIQVAGFLAHVGLSIEFVTFGLLLAGSIPIAAALLKAPAEAVTGNVAFSAN